MKGKNDLIVNEREIKFIVHLHHYYNTGHTMIIISSHPAYTVEW